MCDALLQLDQGFFFNNLFAKLRFFGIAGKLYDQGVQKGAANGSNSTRHLLLVLKSLKNYSPGLLAPNIKELFEIICQNIDNAMVNHDQFQILTSIDICTVLTEFVRDNQGKVEGEIESITPNTNELSPAPKPGVEMATFGAGCYWGVQKLFSTEFRDGKILDSSVGFMSTEDPANIDPDPSYE